MWGQLYILISAVVSLYLVIKFYPPKYRDFKNSLIISGILWILSGVADTVQFEKSEIVADFLLVFANAVLLTAFLMLVRHMKPVIFRYPYQTVFIPFILPVSFFIVIGSEIIQEIIFISMQGVSIFVLIILNAGYRLKVKHKFLSISGLIFLIGAFTVYWFVNEDLVVHDMAWQFFLATGMIFSVFSLKSIFKE